jgi:hypothetical protein
MYNRKQLRDAVAREFGLWEGVATGGWTDVDTYAFLLDTANLTRFHDDFFVGNEIHVASQRTGLPDLWATGYITDFTQATGKCIYVAGTPLYPVDAGDAYQIFRWVTKDDIDRALGPACAGAPIATSLTPKTNSVDYYITNLPGLARREQITGVWLRESNDFRIQPHEIYGYQIEDAETQLVLRLPRLLTAADALWLTYVGDDAYMADDTQSVNLPLQLVVARCCTALIEPLMMQADAGSAERWGAQLRYWAEKLNRLERQRQPSKGRSISYPWRAQSAANRADVALNLLPNF